MYKLDEYLRHGYCTYEYNTIHEMKSCIMGLIYKDVNKYYVLSSKNRQSEKVCMFITKEKYMISNFVHRMCGTSIKHIELFRYNSYNEATNHLINDLK